MKKQIFKNSFLVFIILLVVGFLSIPIIKDMKFGLDLQGGFEVLYEVSTVDGSSMDADKMSSTYKVIIKRVDSLGVSEPNIIVEGDNKIRVQLAGVTDSETARNTLSTIASLSFRDTSDNLLMDSSVINYAKVGQDQYGNPAVSLSVKDKDTFFKVTKAISQSDDKIMVIWLDYDKKYSLETIADVNGRKHYGYYTQNGEEQIFNECGSKTNCLSAAGVEQGFTDDVIIQGNFTEEEVKNLVDLINSGSLPTKLDEISSKTVEASFGKDSLSKTVVAGAIGILLIMVFMTILYRFAGFISSLGIVIYAFVTLFTFWLLGGVLTLPGIAAIVIGIGMAIDSCVLNFARIKDELYEGTKLQMAFVKGNKSSFMTILDGNITTLIVAFILFIFGESSVKGFATMLIISTVVTMIIMVALTRWLLGLFVKTGAFDNKLTALIGINKKDIPDFNKGEKRTKRSIEKVDFVKHTNKFIIFSVIILIVGLVSMIKGGLNLGIDFKGGTNITLKTTNELTKENLTKDINELKYDLENIEYLKNDTVTISIKNALNKDEVIHTEKYFEEKYEVETEIGVVSNIVKKELIKNAIISLIIASLFIVIYVSFRFKFNFAVSSIITLLHDVLIMIAFFALLKLEVNSIFIAAILSIIGYSINDTIVVFDRIRENMKDKKTFKTLDELKNVVNSALRDVVGRSIITTITTLIPVMCLIFLGSHEIFNFNIALLIGLIAGSYSSVFIAAGLWYKMEKRNVGKPIKKKWYEEELNEVSEHKIKGINC